MQYRKLRKDSKGVGFGVCMLRDDCKETLQGSYRGVGFRARKLTIQDLKAYNPIGVASIGAV